MEQECECGERFIPSGRGKKQRFCSVKCRMRAYRRRAADKRNVTENVELQKTVELLRKENQRLHKKIENLQGLLAKYEQKKKAFKPLIRSKTQKHRTPCPICSNPVRLIIDNSDFILPRHREPSGRKICKGSDLVVTESGELRA